MAPRTRLGKARAAAAAEATCLLLDLSHDEVSIVTHELCDPLQPLLAVHLSSTAKGLREAMEEQLAELKQLWQQSAALTAYLNWSWAQLCDARHLDLGAVYHRSLKNLGHTGELSALPLRFVACAPNASRPPHR